MMEWLKDAHEFISSTGMWVAVLSGISATFLLIKHLASLKWQMFEVETRTVKFIVGACVIGAYFYFLGVWGFTPILVIIGLTILFVNKIFKPH